MTTATCQDEAVSRDEPSNADAPALKLVPDDPEAVRIAVSYHEAAHILGLQLFGHDALMVSIRPSLNEALLGHALTLNTDDAPQARLLREMMVVLASGSVAEHIHDPRSEWGGVSDVRRILDLAWKLVGRAADPVIAHREADRAWRRAGVLVRRYWPEIQRVAESLRRHDALVQGIGLFDGSLDTLDEDETTQPAHAGDKEL